MPSALQGEPGDLFYIIKEGEAVVYQDTGGGSRKRVNQLFKADFFGEGALLSDEPRWARHGLRRLCRNECRQLSVGFDACQEMGQWKESLAGQESNWRKHQAPSMAALFFRHLPKIPRHCTIVLAPH